MQPLRYGHATLGPEHLKRGGPGIGSHAGLCQYRHRCQMMINRPTGGGINGMGIASPVDFKKFR